LKVLIIFFNLWKWKVSCFICSFLFLLFCNEYSGVFVFLCVSFSRFSFFHHIENFKCHLFFLRYFLSGISWHIFNGIADTVFNVLPMIFYILIFIVVIKFDVLVVFQLLMFFNVVNEGDSICLALISICDLFSSEFECSKKL